MRWSPFDDWLLTDPRDAEPSGPVEPNPPCDCCGAEGYARTAQGWVCSQECDEALAAWEAHVAAAAEATP